MALPVFRATGVKSVGTTGLVNVSAPSGLVDGDLDIMIATTNPGGTITITGDAGGPWTAMAGSPQDVTGGEKLYVWWRVRRPGDSDPIIQASTDHVCAGRVAYRAGTFDPDSPFENVVVGSETTSDTSFSFAPGGSTSGTDRVVCCIATSGFDSNTHQVPVMTNAQLTALALRATSHQTTQGGGGGFGFTEGARAAAGSVGTFACTYVTASPKAYISFAIKPYPDRYPTSAVLDNFNRANVAPPGTKWLGAYQTNGFQVVSNQLKNPSGNWDEMYWNTALEVDNTAFFAIGTRGATSERFEIWIRTTADKQNAYICEFVFGATDTIILYKRVAGTNTSLGTGSSGTAWATGDVIAFVAIGSRIHLYRKPISTGVWVLLLYFENSDVTAPGRVEIHSSGATHTLDDFGGPPAFSTHSKTGSLVAGSILFGASGVARGSFPNTALLDDFNRANQYPIGSSWLGSTQANGWKVQSNQAFGTPDGFNDEIYWSAAQWTDVEAYFTLAQLNTADGYELDLRARWDRATNTHYTVRLSHWAGATNDSLALYPVVNGVMGAQLGTSFVLPELAVGDKIGISAVGSQIKVWYAPAGSGWITVINQTDTQIPAAGYVGVNGRFGWAIDDFGGGQLAVATTYQKTGSLIAASIVSGADQIERVETGSLIATARQYGIKSQERSKAGSLIATARQSGVDSIERVKTGSLVASGIMSGADSVDRVKAGSLIAISYAAGAESTERNETGSLIARGVQSGIKSQERAKAGSLIARAELYGADSAQYAEFGSLLARAMQSGTTSADKIKSGSLVARAHLSGMDAAQWNELGSLLAKAIASGADVSERAKTGSLTARGHLSGADSSEYQETGALIATSKLSGLPVFTASLTGSLVAKATMSGISFKTIAFIGEDALIMYDLRALVQASLQATYDVRRLELQDLTGQYDLRALRSKTTTAQYDLRALVIRTLIAQYDMGGVVGRALIAQYDLRALRQKDMLAQYDVRRKAPAQLKAYYDLRALALRNLVAQYDLIGRLSKDLQARYDLGGLRSSTIAAFYDVRVKILRNLTSQYDLTNLRSRNAVAQYDLRALKRKDVQAQYDLRALVNETLQIVYDVQNKIFEDLTAQYDTRIFTDQELVAIYDKIGRLVFDLVVQYDILGHIDTDKAEGIILHDSALEESLIIRRRDTWAKIITLGKSQSTILRRDKGWALIKYRREESDGH